MLFNITLQYLYKGGKIQQLEWDISTVTAGDYTVEFPIHKKYYQVWYNNVYKKAGGEFEQGYSPALSLKRHLIQEIEGILEEEFRKRGGQAISLGEQRKSSAAAINDNFRVADLVFAYANSDLIHALRARG